MFERSRVAVFSLVVLGHLALGWFLANAMRPPVFEPATSDEAVLYLDFLPALPVAVVAPEPESDPAASRPPRRDRRREPRAESPPMQAVFESTPTVPSAQVPPEAREFVAPQRDPFHRAPPTADVDTARSDPVRSPDAVLPRLPGAAPPHAVIPEIPVHEFGAREAIHLVGAIATGAAIPLGPKPPPRTVPSCEGMPGADTVTDQAAWSGWRREFGCSPPEDE